MRAEVALLEIDCALAALGTPQPRTLEDVLAEALRIASPATINAYLDALPPGCCSTCIDGECHGTPEQRTACTALDANEPDPQQPRGERTCGECKHYNTLMGGCRAVARVGPLAVDTDATTCPAFTAREEVARPCSDPAECPDCAHGCEKGERRG